MRVELQDVDGRRVGSVLVPYTKRAPEVVIHGTSVFILATGPTSRGEALAYRLTHAVWDSSGQEVFP